MGSSGPMYPSAAANGTEGVVSWTNIANIKVNDGSPATAGLSSVNTLSKGAFGSGYGFSILSYAQIDGILLEFSAKRDSGGTIAAFATSAYKAGSFVSFGTATFTDLTTAYADYSIGGPTQKHGTTWTPSDINNSGFGISLRFQYNTSSPVVSLDWVRITVYWSLPAPTSVSASYGSYTRTGPNNTPWTCNFTTGAGETSYEIRTASGGAGTLVASGACTASAANAKTVAYNASGLVAGSQTLYVRVGDGTYWSPDTSFTLLRDDSVSAPTSISHSPNPVESNNQYSVTFTATDTYSTSTNEMSYQVRTAAGGGGTLLASGNFTQGTGKSTSTFTDSGLTDGATRYLRVFDGANNVAEQSFTVTKVTTKPFRRALLGVGF